MAKKKNKGKSSKTLKDHCGSDEASFTNDKTVKTLASIKVCRLCEIKDGPFLNIFDGEKIIGKKIDALLPFTVLEEDDLPHIICFRCSAKVEEMYEFVQKCTNTQDNLIKAMGRHTFTTKKRTRLLWDTKLNESNMNNDDICNAIVQKALQSITDVSNLEGATEDATDTQKERRVSLKREAKSNIKLQMDDHDDIVPIKQLKIEKTEESCSIKTEETLKSDKNNQVKKTAEIDQLEQKQTIESKNTTSNKNFLSFDYNDTSNSAGNSSDKKDKSLAPEKVDKPFDIMDHISTIKVNGVGILFQCKLCNRNFLKKEVVLVHGCAKSGKIEIRKATPPPEPRKPAVNTVGYINLKTDLKKPPEKPAISLDTAKVEIKPKPKIGPASKVKKTDAESSPSIGMMIHPRVPTPPASIIQIPTAPSINTRYKLVPGPNNTFSLIEDPNSTEPQETTSKLSTSKTKQNEDLKLLLKSRPGLVVKNDVINLDATLNSDSDEDVERPVSPCKTKQKRPGPKNPKGKPSRNVEPKSTVEPTNQPYPVGMYQSHQNINPPVPNDPAHQSMRFTTPAMRKQSYTVVQTGNPSKLLISTRPTLQPAEEPKPRKTYSNINQVSKQPFKVTLEDAAPKTSGFFTYVNIDPLLKPSHVIPSDDIIQESQISTSTSIEKEKTKKNDQGDSSYPCNLCTETFSREKKLLAHIQAHYKQMDKEDEVRDKPSRRRKT